MKKVIFIFLLAILLVTACSVDTSEEKSDEDTEDKSAKENEEQESGEKSEDDNEASIQTIDSNGNYQYDCIEGDQYEMRTWGEDVHAIFSAYSDDLTNWEEEDYIQVGSVPEVVYHNNKYYMFVMGSCFIFESDDGLEFTATSYTFHTDSFPNDFQGFDGVDPAVMVVDDRFYLYYFDPDWGDDPPGDPAQLAGAHDFTLAYSDNAIDWYYDSLALRIDEGGTDPDIVFYNDLYYLFTSAGTNVRAAVSETYTDFEALNNNNYVNSLGGVPDTIVADNVMYQFGNKNRGGSNTDIVVSTSTNGEDWQYFETAVENGGGASIVALPEGGYRLYFVRHFTENEFLELYG